ncbi:hypothetical protein HYPSUDRAFT_32668 [Hypholoma sublateritium FD-334 SS-4]|uniref:Uncharacterized protein n=1 Tax=Hypholoma sublateritium (strain FD-334 SS-4) TaxID=945553 RepID=A0A0D2QCC2_HYPSF|nr:hypothetical protein HYPSUDRAFT_32668 [Hypholoma sublateritium FD-334 SS-4]
MVTAGSFTEYLLKTGRLCNTLFVYEAWNYLLSVLITILGREVSQEEEPLALLSITGVCCGLYELVRKSNMPTRDRILSSPWTATMKALLQKLTDNKAADPYFQSLSRRLMNIGIRLLREITIDFGVENNPTQDIDLVVCAKLGSQSTPLTVIQRSLAVVVG